MKRVFDVSLVLSPDMVTWPGEPGPRIVAGGEEGEAESGKALRFRPRRIAGGGECLA